MDTSIGTAFLVGLLGGVHCAGMCGGIVAAMSGPTTIAPRRTTIMIRAAAPEANTLAGTSAYNLGRLVTYAAGGAVVGSLGSIANLAATLLPVQQIAFVMMNLVLLVLGLRHMGALRTLGVLDTTGNGVWRRLQPLAARSLGANTLPRKFAAGLVWGWVPCAMVYGMLLAALASRSPSHGAALMATFWLGTLPNLLGLAWVATRSRNLFRSAHARLAGGALIVVFALVGLTRLDPPAAFQALLSLCWSPTPR